MWPCGLTDDFDKNRAPLPCASCRSHLVNINWSYSPETPNLGQIRRILEPCDLQIWRMTLKNNRAPLLCYFELCASFRSHWWIQTGVIVQKRPIWVIRPFCVLCDLEFWWMTLKNNRAPLRYCFKLCASFRSHWWIQTKVTVRKRSIRVKIGGLLSRVTLKFDGWPWKTIGHLFDVASSFMHDFIAISEFKIMLQSENAQFGSKSAIHCPVRVTLKFGTWPWKTIGHLF